MRKSLLIIYLLVATSLTAQDIVVRGRITDPGGQPVEYATIGIPGTKNGTLTSHDGTFELAIPQECHHTLTARHVSYSEARIPATVYRNSDGRLDVTMYPRPLEDIVVFNGKRKKAKLVNKGMRLPGGTTTMDISFIGNEIGSVVETKHPFEISEIIFNTVANSIDKAKLSINIYSADTIENRFRNVMHHPIYTDIPEGKKKIEHTIVPQERIILTPGVYFVAVKFVDGCRNDPEKEKIAFPLYIKSGYIRRSAVEHPEKSPFNLGLQINGFEYR